MDAKTILLGLLTYGSMSGYELRKGFSISFAFFSGLSYGSIYPTLKKMQQEGLVTQRTEIQQTAPNKKVYTITEAGRAVFVDSLRTPVTLEKFKNAFLMRLFFFAHLTPDERLATAKGYLDSLTKAQRELDGAASEIKARADRYQYLCFEFGQRFLTAMSAGISEIVKALEDDKGLIP
jgi:DNA-binding PadR family transcriptional regulator